jgi:phosphonate transport system permease protein
VRASLPLLPLLPALVLVPLLLILPAQVHPGGAELLGRFLQAAVSPSLDPHLLASLLCGLGVTVGMALLGWLISLLAGLVLGMASSRTVWATTLGTPWPAQLIRRLLALPRAIHELLWGLLLLLLFGLQPAVAVLAIAIPYGALVARVVADLTDALPTDRLEALRSSGAAAGPALLTALAPALLPGVLSYGGYRLECALRSATLLGVFGLGGLGTELRLTLQSLEFRELWSGLWLLLIVMLALESAMAWLRGRWGMPRRFSLDQHRGVGWRGRELALALLALVPLSLWVGWAMGVDPRGLLHPQPLPPLQGGSWQAVVALPWPALVGGTLLLTAVSALLAVGLPPLQLLLVAPWPLAGGVVRLGWALLRLWPPPLTVLLLLFVLQPGVLPAALALGLHNGGILGRLLQEGLQDKGARAAQALSIAGCGPRMALLYGDLPPVARPYLAYGAYRADVMLRETVVVGLAGAAGLGSQLLESLSSFAWDQLAALVLVYAALTLLGEDLSDRLRRRWLGAI